jgi:MFS family permease
MIVAQGTLGYSLTSVMGAIPAEIFEGRHFGSIFGTVMLSAVLGGAAGPWVAGALHDSVGSYAPAFWICIGLSSSSAEVSGARHTRRTRRLPRSASITGRLP